MVGSWPICEEFIVRFHVSSPVEAEQRGNKCQISHQSRSTEICLLLGLPALSLRCHPDLKPARPRWRKKGLKLPKQAVALLHKPLQAWHINDKAEGWLNWVSFRWNFIKHVIAVLPPISSVLTAETKKKTSFWKPQDPDLLFYFTNSRDGNLWNRRKHSQSSVTKTGQTPFLNMTFLFTLFTLFFFFLCYSTDINNYTKRYEVGED